MKYEIVIFKKILRITNKNITISNYSVNPLTLCMPLR